MNVQREKSPPNSLCSLPCRKREQRIQQLLPCCWKCKPCRENEIVTGNGTECRQCDEKFWPGDDGATCQPIDPEYIHWTQPISICLTTFSALSIILSVLSLSFFIKHRENKLVKASSWNLMLITIFGIIWAHTAVFIFIAKPSDVSCVSSLYSFHLSIALIYSPVLVKSNRIYRIFSIKKTGKTKLYWISQKSQMFLVFASIFFLVSTYEDYF